MVKEMIFGTVGGLGLFLFGMVLMSEGLRKGAGPKLKSILESMTKKSLRGFFVGAGVTAVIQSSSATTVIIVGLVNAGLLTLKQAIGVIIGSNVGTTATAWLVSASGLEFLDISMYSMPAIGLGFLLYMGGRTRKWKSVGEIMLGFGILFLGIDFMKGGFASLEDSPRVQELFISLGGKPVWALLAGLGLTTLIQSSSASIAIVQLLAMGGAFSNNWTAALNTAIPFVLGANIGTTITAQLAALQANRNGKRAAWAHTMFNVLGSVIAFPFVYLGWYSKMVLAICPWGLSSEWVGATIAVAHSFFNIANSCIFLPLSPVLAKVAVWLVPVRPTEAAMPPVVLEKHLLDAPEIAIEQSKRQIVHMAKTAKRAFSHAIEGIMEDNRKKLDAVKDIEDVIDSLQFEITSYLSALSGRPMADGISVRLPVLLHAVNDLERVGDHAMNIMEIAQRKIEQKLTFSDSARVEAQMLRTNAEQMFDDIIAALETGDIAPARAALTIEKRLNEAQVELRRTHVGRMSDGACSAQAGLIFIDLVDNVEKIGDHLTNIAQAVIGGLQWEGIKPKIVQGL
jgi:phosphate:Na+ symporter